MIEFKSTLEMYLKERDGKKNNTVRKVKESDPRFKRLQEMDVLEGAIDDDEDSVIRIINAHNEFEFFDRQIKDVTSWDDFFIITWRD